MSGKINAKQISYMAVFTALIYITTSISVAMPPPLGAWHMGNLMSFLSAILCGPLVGAFSCAVGAGLFDVWNPLHGSRFIVYAPATLVIRGTMGYLIGKIAYGRDEPRNYVIAAVLFGHIWKNVGYTIYDWYLYGALAFFDLWTLSVKSVFEIILTFTVLAAVRRSIGRNYLV
jgi:uncharacterized membrane protein